MCGVTGTEVAVEVGTCFCGKGRGSKKGVSVLLHSRSTPEHFAHALQAGPPLGRYNACFLRLFDQLFLHCMKANGMSEVF